MEEEKKLRIAMLKIQVILAEADAEIYYDEVAETLRLENATADAPSIEFQNPDFI